VSGKEIEGEFTRCPACGQPVGVGDPNAVGAVRPLDTGPNLNRTAGDQIEDGIGALFHAGCFPSAGPGWRRVTNQP
jgi:hypothetical protein